MPIIPDEDMSEWLVVWPYGPWKGKMFKEVVKNPEWVKAILSCDPPIRKDTCLFLDAFRVYVEGLPVGRHFGEAVGAA